VSTAPDSLVFPQTRATVHTLPNGLEVIINEDHAAPVVSLQAWCRSGSIHEGEWLGAGVSHYLEHMLFKGSARRNANEIAQTVQEQGGYINAYTSFDRTVYWIDAPSSGWRTCLDVLCDVVGHARLPEDEFTREQDVIRREIAMGEDNPEQVLSRALFRTAYAVHPCRHPVIGYLDLFNQLTATEVAGYYQQRYGPDQIFMVIAGAIESEEVIAEIERHLGSLQRRRNTPALIADEPRQVGRRDEEITFATELQRGRLAWQIPSGHSPDAAALDLAATILGHGRSSRLYRAIREERQLAHSIGTYAYTPGFTGQFVISYETEPGKGEAAEAAIFDEMARFCGGGVTEEELAKAKKMCLGEQFSTLSSVRGQASDLGSNWLLTRNLDLTRHYAESLESITAEDLARVSTTYLASPDCTRIVMRPADSAAPVRVRSGGQRSDDFRRVTLDSGLTILLLSDQRLPMVHAQAYFRGGVLAETATTNGVSALLGRLLTKDTTKRSAEALALAIESVGGSISGGTGNNSLGLGVHALRPDLSLAIELLAETLTSPALLEDVVTKERQFLLAQIKAERDRPFSVAMKQLRRDLYGEHPYGLPGQGSEESVATLGRPELLTQHSHLICGNNGVVGVFGDLDLDRAEDLLRTRFDGKLPAGQRSCTEALPVTLFPASLNSRIDLHHEKEQAVLVIGYRTVPLHHPDHLALKLIDEACSDMASRFFIRIREELALAYSVGATRLEGLEPGAIIFYASTAPESLDQVEIEMLDEIQKMVKDGLEPAEFERAKASWLGRELIQLQGAAALASTATVDELLGQGWDFHRREPAAVAALTLEEVHEVAARYLVAERRAIVRVRP